MTDLEIIQILIKAKELGITQADIESFKNVPRGDQVEQPQLVESDLKDIMPKSILDDLSEEEILFWATPTYDEIQEEKRLKEQYKATGEVD